MAAAARGKAGAGLQEGARPALVTRVAGRVGRIGRVFMVLLQREQSGMPGAQAPLRRRWLACFCADLRRCLMRSRTGVLLPWPILMNASAAGPPQADWSGVAVGAEAGS